MGNYIVVSKKVIANKEAEPKTMRITGALAAQRAFPSGNLDQFEREHTGKKKGRRSGIYLIGSPAGSEFASAPGEQALGGLTSFASKSPCRVQEILSALSNILSVHDSPKVARWAADMGSTGWCAVFP